MRASKSAVAVVLVLVGACAKSEAPAPNKNTNWLHECSTDDDCGEALACLCGVCTHTCDAPDACDDEGAAASCRSVQSDALVGQCDDSLERGSVCVAACRADEDCAALAQGSHCEERVCLTRMNDYVALGEPDGGSAGSSGSAGSDGGAGSGGSVGSDGGAGSGGSAARDGGAGSAGMPAQLNECEVDNDCKVDGDCCSCVAVPSDADVPPTCDATCAEDRCAQLGVSAVCAAGRCILDATCDDSEVTCEALPPECAPGEQPTVQGECWGGCVDVRDCLAVKTCDACGDDQACVSPGIYGPRPALPGGLQCWDVAPACEGAPSCECMGSSICEPFQCDDDSNQPDASIDISCHCLLC